MEQSPLLLTSPGNHATNAPDGHSENIHPAPEVRPPQRRQPGTGAQDIYIGNFRICTDSPLPSAPSACT